MKHKNKWYEFLMRHIYDIVTIIKKPKNKRKIVVIGHYQKIVEISWRDGTQLPVLMVILLDVDSETNEVVFGEVLASIF
jgi:hypothetical protein